MDKRQADILGALCAGAQMLGYYWLLRLLDEIRDSELRRGAIDVPFHEHIPATDEAL